MRIVLCLIVVGFLALCGWLVVQTGFFNGSQAAGESRCILLQQTTAKTADTVKVTAGGDARLEAADFTTLATARAAGVGENFRIASASSTFLPRTWSNTSHNFCGDTLTCLAVAITSITSSSPW